MNFLTAHCYSENCLHPKQQESIFKNIFFYNGEPSDLKKHQIGIVGTDPETLNGFRNHFYNLGDHFQASILDLGVIEYDNTAQLQARIDQLSKEIALIVIGGEPLHNAKETYCYLSNKLESCSSEMHSIAYQRHTTSRDQYLNTNHLSHLSLGEVKNNASVVEPYLRNSKKLIVNPNVIKKADSHFKGSDLCGLTIEETCQIARYAGISPSIEQIQFASIDSADHGNRLYECASVISWYFLEGFMNKKFENAADRNNTCYIIQNEYFENPLKFITSTESGRWWVQLEGESEYMPCLYEDYVSCKSGQIPDRLLALV